MNGLPVWRVRRVEVAKIRASALPTICIIVADAVAYFSRRRAVEMNDELFKKVVFKQLPLLHPPTYDVNVSY